MLMKFFFFALLERKAQQPHDKKKIIREMSTDLAREISAKLPADQLDQVCANAPEGTNSEGISYKDLCSKCISTDMSSENQKSCVANVVANFVESTQAAPPQEPATSLNASSTDLELQDSTDLYF